MKILELSLEGFLGAPDGTYSFQHPHTHDPLPVVVVTGPAQSGKTSLLEAIIAVKELVGSYGAPPDARSLARRGARSGAAVATWRLSPAEMERAGTTQAIWRTEVTVGEGAPPPDVDPRFQSVLEAHSLEPQCGKFEYFAADRRLPRRDGLAEPPILPSTVEAATRLRRGAEKYLGVHRALVECALADATRRLTQLKERGIAFASEEGDALTPYRKVLAGLLPQLRLDGLETYRGQQVVRFVRRDGTWCTLTELSEGERQVVLLAVTFLQLGLNDSVVLIDEPELHLHPDNHVGVLQALAGLGLDNQLIVATSSPEIVRFASEHERIRLAVRP